MKEIKKKKKIYWSDKVGSPTAGSSIQFDVVLLGAKSL